MPDEIRKTYEEGILKGFPLPVRPDDNRPPKLDMPAFPTNGTPEFYYYIGWLDFRATQEKFIREKREFLVKWATLKGNLDRLFTPFVEYVGDPIRQINHGNGCPNPFYEMGVQDALDIADHRPLELVKPYWEVMDVTPWTAPRISSDQPGTEGVERCDQCKHEGTKFLYVERGPAYNHVVCSEKCLVNITKFYVEKDNFTMLLANGQINRPVVTLDRSVTKLREMLSALPARSTERSVRKSSGFDFAD